MTVLKKILEPEQKRRFVEGLKRFKERQLDIRKEACSWLASLIEDCREEAIVQIQKNEYEQKDKVEAAKEKVARIINGAFAEFTYGVSDLYKISAENPTTSKDDLILKMEPKTNWSKRISTGSGVAAIFGTTTGFITGIVGAAVMGFLTGGVGAITGGITWAQVGASIGAAIGSLVVFSDDGDTVTIKIEIAQLKNLLIKGIAIIWGLSNNGFGRGRELSSDESKQVEMQVLHASDSCREINWSNNKLTIIEYCEKILDHLETEIE